MIFATIQTKFPFLISCFPDYKIPALSSNALIRLSRAIRLNQENWKPGTRNPRRLVPEDPARPVPCRFRLVRFAAISYTLRPLKASTRHDFSQGSENL